MQKLLTKKERHQPHAAQENPERHLVTPQRNLRRSPGVSPGGRPGFAKHLLPPLRTLDPNNEDGPKAEERSRDRRRKNRQNGEAKPGECTDHCHELDVAKAHSFHSAPAQVNSSRAV